MQSHPVYPAVMIYAKDVKKGGGDSQRGCIYKVVTDTSSVTRLLRLYLVMASFRALLVLGEDLFTFVYVCVC